MINQTIAKRKATFLLTGTDWHTRTVQLHFGNCRTDITTHCFHSFFTQRSRLIQPEIYVRLNHIRSSESNSPVLAD